jgi:ribose transport system substrate-binding protein
MLGSFGEVFRRPAALLLVMLFVVAGVATSCGGDDEDSAGADTATSGEKKSAEGKDSEPVRIAFFSIAISNVYTQQAEKAIKEVAADRNATVEVFDGAFDRRKQFAQVQDAISSGKFDAFLAVPIDATGLVPVMEQAIKQGIEVGTISYPLGPDLEGSEPQVEGQAISVLDPSGLRGQWIGELTVQACEGIDPCKVVYFHGTKANPADQVQRAGFDKEIAKNPAIEVVAEGEGGFLSEPALKEMQNILQREPDPNVVVAIGDQMTHGASIALKAANKPYGTGEGEVRLIGLGASKLAVDGVNSGDWFATALALPFDEGRLAAEGILDAARGIVKEPQGVSAVEESGLNPLGTKENLVDFEPQWAG